VLTVGLTGGIGAGKSEVAGRLVELGAVLVDADKLARDVVARGTDGLAEVVSAFGREVLNADGALDRSALGGRVFRDDQARRRLEAIVHPRVRARTAELVAGAPPDAVVVNDVPLLLETGLAPAFHLVVVVEADEKVRVARLVRDRGMTAEQAAARIAAQASDTARRAAADVLLRNDGSLDDLRAAVDRLWRDRLVPFERRLRAGQPAPAPAVLRLAGPDPTWPDQAGRLLGRLIQVVRRADVGLAHIGSTAIPGLPGRDVIDLQVGVPTVADGDALAGALVGAGFAPRPPEPASGADEGWWRRRYASADPGRPANLYIRVVGSPGWRSTLLIRDHLRSDEAARDGYAAVKRSLAERSADPAAYAAGKKAWFAEELRTAEDWANRTDWVLRYR
jgi:dephospho-CoA kinase